MRSSTVICSRIKNPGETEILATVCVFPRNKFICDQLHLEILSKVSLASIILLSSIGCQTISLIKYIVCHNRWQNAISQQLKLCGCWSKSSPGVHNLFAIAGSITFILMNYGRQ